MPEEVTIRTSEALVLGDVYTRAALREIFGITDATINTGIFQPPGHESIWLFVTESKTSDRTQYVDQLAADVLHWQGQSAGRKDALIREHRERGLELLLFYRHKKYEFEAAGFRYEGTFDYVNDEGEHPASFVLHRHRDELAIAQAQAEHVGAFDPDSAKDARARTLASIVRRQGQEAFRNGLLRAYERRCAITACEITHVLEAAHIYPYQGDATNSITNGLLLRADLHTLFDLGWISIQESSMTVIVHPALQSSEYNQWHGIPLRLPVNPAHRPSSAALAWHRTNLSRSNALF
jgi:hypothetical protein